MEELHNIKALYGGGGVLSLYGLSKSADLLTQ